MTIIHHHGDLAASLAAKILGVRKIIDIIKTHSAQFKGSKIHLHPGSQCAREAHSAEIPARAPLGWELSYLTEQIKIRTSYLCLTALASQREITSLSRHSSLGFNLTRTLPFTLCLQSKAAVHRNAINWW